MERLGPLSLLFLTVGCSPNLQTGGQAAAEQPKEIQIVSVPAGKRIEVNDDYVGDAPITIKVPQITVSPNGKTAYVAMRDSVNKINLATNKAANIPLNPVGSVSFTFSPDGQNFI